VKWSNNKSGDPGYCYFAMQVPSYCVGSIFPHKVNTLLLPAQGGGREISTTSIFIVGVLMVFKGLMGFLFEAYNPFDP